MAKQEGKSFQSILSDLKARNFAPFYLLSGEEDYYIDRLSDYIEQNVIDEQMRDFDQSVVYGLDVDMRTVVEMAKRYPVMSEYQLVLVKEAQNIKDLKGDWETLSNYLDSPNNRTILVLCYRHKKIDKRLSIFKKINGVGVFFEHNKLRDEQIPSWIEQQVCEHGYSINSKSTLLLAEFLGNDLTKISNELKKLFVSLPQGGQINEDLIERNVGISKDYNVFELQRAIAMRDVVKCNKIVNYFAANPKSNPIQMVIPQIYGYLVKVMIYLQTPDKKEAPVAMGISPYFIRDYEVAARNYSLGKLASCIGYLYDADLRSKGVRNSGTVTDGELLKELVFKIIH